MSRPVLLIAGGSRGIGAATAKMGGTRGYDVAVNYKSNAKAADEVVAAVKAAGGKSVEGKKLLDQITKLVDDIKRRSDKLAHALEHEGDGDAVKHAKHFRDVVIPAMNALRESGDAIELLVPHGSWPLATYREMLFIK